MTTEYLTDIKFRNAVKKATKLSVAGKNSYDRHAVHIDQSSIVGKDDTLFNVEYYSGRFSDSAETVRIDGEKRVRLVQDLMMAGFECVEVEMMNNISRERFIGRAYRKAVN